MIEYEVTLECNYKCPYCTNGRNERLKNPIPETEDLVALEEFLKSNDDFYLYGGEPLLAKNIEFIIKTLKDNHKTYVVQTNFSIEKAIKRLTSIDPNIKFQISVHRTQVKNTWNLIKRLNECRNNITQIDVMFTDINDFYLYRFMQRYVFCKSKLRLVPVADFASNKLTFFRSLHLYNLLRRSSLKDIIFDDGERSYVWENQFLGKINILGKECICKDQYIQYDPSLNKHHCPQRYDGVICPFRSCFNLDKPIKLDS